MDIGVLVRQIRPQAEIDELVLAGQQNFFNMPECAVEFIWVLLVRARIQDAVVIDWRERPRRGAPSSDEVKVKLLMK